MHELVQNRIIIRTLLNLNHYMTTPYAPYTGINDLKILEITPPESYLHYIVYNCRLPKTTSGVQIVFHRYQIPILIPGEDMAIIGMK